jgi:hypothetical protein
MTLRLVTQDALRADWLAVREHIEDLRRRQKSQWLIEDVYHMLRSGIATLWLRDPLQACYVTLPQAEPFSGRRVLTLWIGWKAADDYDLKADADELRKIAAAQGCEVVKFVSPRPGWGRRAAQIGFSPGESTWEAPALNGEVTA